MLRRLLWPFFKKHLGLFISMVFISMLSIGMLACFGSTVVNLQRDYTSYLERNGEVDEQIHTQFTTRENLLAACDIPEVDKVDVRLTMDAYLHKDNGRNIITRIFTYNEEENQIFHRVIVDKEETPYQGGACISISRKFARTNGFKVGQTLKIGYFGFFLDFHVSEIVDTVEAIYPRANDYVWSDNRDFGYIYISEPHMNQALDDLANRVKDRVENDPEYADLYHEIIEVLGINVPDVIHIPLDFAFSFGNQLLVKNAPGYDDNFVMNKIKANLADRGVEVKTATLGVNLPYRIYMNNALRQLRVAAIFLPVFFYAVSMIIIGLFMNQIIKTMTPDIGVMMSIGVGKWDIISIFLVFTAIMVAASAVFGSFMGWGLNAYMTGILSRTYALPGITTSLDPLVTILAIVGMGIFAELAAFLSCLAIFRITPKDAVISNESKRKKLPKWLDRFIDKAPMNIKLATNSIAQNPRRFLVSSFSIFASTVLILLSCNFYVAKNVMIGQSTKTRLDYDCQIYLTQKEDQAFIDDLKIQDFVKKDEAGEPLLEDCYYTYIPVDGKNVYLECLALDEGQPDLINIPNADGKGALPITSEGLILTTSAAQQLGKKKGDTVPLNGVDVQIVAISAQYFHPITYLSKTQMDAIGVSYVTTIILDVADETAFLEYLSENKNQCLTVFTKNLARDLNDIFDSVSIMIAIMVAFSVGLAGVILSIMSQNALLEQKRQLSVMRALGFRMANISNNWSLQSLLQVLLSALISVPAGSLFSMLLFSMCSSASQIYPFVFSWPVVFMGLGFVFLVVVFCHFLAMFKIRRWCIADNVRSRE